MITTFSAFNNLRFWARDTLGGADAGLRIIKLHPRLRDKVIRKDSVMCVEGFPRCANSFLYEIISSRMPHQHIAHHVHVSTQVLQALKYAVPSVVVIREPLDAVASLLAVTDGRLSPNLALSSYIRFYESVDKHVDKVYVADFPRVTKETLTVLQEIDQRFGTRLSAVGFVDADKDSVMDRLVRKNREMNQPANLVAVPDSRKSSSLTGAKSVLQDNPLLEVAQQIYAKWREKS